MDSPPPISVRQTAWRWWKHAAAYEGYFRATRRLLGVMWNFVRDSTPERLRLRFGDADYDWHYRVNTTSGAVQWRDRLLGGFLSEYQPTEPAAFHEMLDALQQQAGIRDANLNHAGRDCVTPDRTTSDRTTSDRTTLDRGVLPLGNFTFLDLGSGKGRTLLMASDYPFRRIVGVELLPALHQIALENLRQYKSESQKCFALESICADATAFPFPDGPLVIYLFNPFGESGLRRVIANLEQTLRTHPRAVYVLYHNPLLEHVFSESPVLRKMGGTEQCSMFAGQVAGG